jgi:hypothetical protein
VLKQLKVFEFKGLLKALEKVLEKVFGLKVFEFEGALPFEVFELEVLKVLEFERGSHSNELRKRAWLEGINNQQKLAAGAVCR